jgi:hypothetical protein
MEQERVWYPRVPVIEGELVTAIRTLADRG